MPLAAMSPGPITQSAGTGLGIVGWATGALNPFCRKLKCAGDGKGWSGGSTRPDGEAESSRSPTVSVHSLGLLFLRREGEPASKDQGEQSKGLPRGRVFSLH